MPTPRLSTSSRTTASTSGSSSCTTPKPITRPLTTPISRANDTLNAENGSSRRLTSGTITAKTGAAVAPSQTQICQETPATITIRATCCHSLRAMAAHASLRRGDATATAAAACPGTACRRQPARAASRARMRPCSMKRVAWASRPAEEGAQLVPRPLALRAEVGAVEDLPVLQHRHDDRVVVQPQVVDAGLGDGHRVALEVGHPGPGHGEADHLVADRATSSRRAPGPAPPAPGCGRRSCAGSRPARSGRAAARRSGSRWPRRCCGARPGWPVPGTRRRRRPAARVFSPESYPAVMCSIRSASSLTGSTPRVTTR